MANVNGSSPTLINCTFTGNSAQGRGGGMYSHWNSSPTIANCTFGGTSVFQRSSVRRPARGLGTRSAVRTLLARPSAHAGDPVRHQIAVGPADASTNQAVAPVDARVVMLEPFLLPCPPDRRAWREDLDPKIAAARRLAREFADVYVPLDGLFAAASVGAGPE